MNRVIIESSVDSALDDVIYTIEKENSDKDSKFKFKKKNDNAEKQELQKRKKVLLKAAVATGVVITASIVLLNKLEKEGGVSGKTLADKRKKLNNLDKQNKEIKDLISKNTDNAELAAIGKKLDWVTSKAHENYNSLTRVSDAMDKSAKNVVEDIQYIKDNRKDKAAKSAAKVRKKEDFANVRQYQNSVAGRSNLANKYSSKGKKLYKDALKTID